MNSSRDEDIATLRTLASIAMPVSLGQKMAFIAKTVDTSRFAAIGGQHGKHCPE